MARLRESDPLPCEARRTKARIEEDSARRPAKQCAKCAGHDVQRHEKRQRWFQQVVDRIVWPIHCWLYRWRCATCGTTFTHLPAFCVPFKRYLRAEIEARAGAYVETEALSYREAVREGGSAVVYPDAIAEAGATEAEKEREAARELTASTVHRWIGAIAACREQWQPAVRLAAQWAHGLRAPLIPATKYCRAARRRVLEACAVLLRALKIVTAKNPPQFATPGSSP